MTIPSTLSYFCRGRFSWVMRFLCVRMRLGDGSVAKIGMDRDKTEDRSAVPLLFSSLAVKGGVHHPAAVAFGMRTSVQN